MFEVFKYIEELVGVHVFILILQGSRADGSVEVNPFAQNTEES
jgi:hypothetical protein